MYTPPFLEHHLISPNYAMQLEPKTAKSLISDKDVERFEKILSGQESYLPKSIELILPVDKPNPVERIGSNVLNRITDLKQSVNKRMDVVGELFAESDTLNINNALKVQWELMMFSIESTLITTVASKAGEGIKTLFRNQ